MTNDPREIVMVTNGDTTKPKFHRLHRRQPYYEGQIYLKKGTCCGLGEWEEHDIYLQVRHAEKFASPCKNKKCFG